MTHVTSTPTSVKATSAVTRIATLARTAWADAGAANRRLAEMKIDLHRDNAF